MSLSAAAIQILKDNASLILAPSAPYGVGGFQSIRPFSEAGRFDFSRTTTKTVDGRTVPINTPAVNDEGALVFEPARTNLITYSDDISNVAWNKVKTGTGVIPSVTYGNADSPFSGHLSSRIQFNTGGGISSGDNSYLNFSIGGLSNPHTSTISVYFKSFTGLTYTIGIYQSSGAILNIEVTNEWQRFELTRTTNATTDYFRCGVIGGVGHSVEADVLMIGAQFEIGSYATSYIPTAGSTVTRTVDAPDLKKQTLTGDFFIFINFKIPARLVGIFDFYSAASGRIFYLAIDAIGKATINSVLGGAVQTSFGPIYNAGDEIKVLIRKNASAGTFSLFIAGTKHGVDLTTTAADLNRIIRLGSFGYEISIALNVLALGDVAISDATAIELTT